jgi:menaquinone-dependent protoporphyrinogen oxidase
MTSSPRILIVYSTVDGHTVKICSRLKASLEAAQCSVTVAAIDQAEQFPVASFDKIVIGASIRYGKHRQAVYDFIARHLETLNSRASAFFSVNIVARKPEKNRPETNPYVQKFLKVVAWRPKELEVFAGKLDYPRYGFLDRLMIRFIMLITKGPTDPTTIIEYTDWNQVDAFAQRIRSM